MANYMMIRVPVVPESKKLIASLLEIEGSAVETVGESNLGNVSLAEAARMLDYSYLHFRKLVVEKKAIPYSQKSPGSKIMLRKIDVLRYGKKAAVVYAPETGL